jgi:hypothetical protein
LELRADRTSAIQCRGRIRARGAQWDRTPKSRRTNYRSFSFDGSRAYSSAWA